MIINISVVDKRPTVAGVPVIVCGNSDYTIEFAFDREWEAYALKTARFVYHRNGEIKAIDAPFSGTTVEVPVLSGIREVYVGVYAGELHTTTPAKILCIKSILCAGGTHEDPPADVYLQILKLIEEAGTIGPPGHTPEKYVDYFTPEDVQEVVDAAVEAVAKGSPYVTPQMYGAAGDGTTDDTDAIQAAIDSGLPVTIPAAVFKTSAPLVISKNNTIVQSYGEIIYGGTEYAVILDSCANCDVYFKRITASNGGGLKLYSGSALCAYNNISVGEITAKNTGICNLSERGNQYNEIRFVKINADVCIDIQCAATGWNTETKWYGGHMGGVDKHATYAIKAINTTSNDMNTHRFYNVGFEGVVDGCILENAGFFVFENPRTSESIDNKAFILKSCVEGCVFRLSHCYLRWIDYSMHTSDSNGAKANGNTFSGIFLSNYGEIYRFSYFEIHAGKMFNCNQKEFGYMNINSEDNLLTLDLTKSKFAQELMVGRNGCVLDKKYYHSGNINTLYVCMNGDIDSTAVIEDSEGKVIARIADYPWKKLRLTAMGYPSTVFDLAPNGWVVEVLD